MKPSPLGRNAADARRARLVAAYGNFAVAVALLIISAGLGAHAFLFPTGDFWMNLLAMLLCGLFAWGSGYCGREAVRLVGDAK